MHALVGTPQEVYRYPRTRFVAQFLGQANVVSGTYAGTSHGYGLVRISDGLAIKVNPALWLSAGSTVDIVVRAYRIQIATDEPPPQVGLNRMEATVKDASFLGNDASYFVEAARSACRPLELRAPSSSRKGGRSG